MFSVLNSYKNKVRFKEKNYLRMVETRYHKENDSY